MLFIRAVTSRSGVPLLWMTEPGRFSTRADFIGTEFHVKLFGNEVCCTNASLLLVKNILCSKLQCQKGVSLILVSYTIEEGRRSVLMLRWGGGGGRGGRWRGRGMRTVLLKGRMLLK